MYDFIFIILDTSVSKSLLYALSDILAFRPTTRADFNLRQRQCSMTHQRQDELLL